MHHFLSDCNLRKYPITQGFLSLPDPDFDGDSSVLAYFALASGVILTFRGEEALFVWNLYTQLNPEISDRQHQTCCHSPQSARTPAYEMGELEG